MKTSARYLFALVVLSALTFALANSAFAHEVRPAFLRLTELSPGFDALPRFAAQFKQPQVDGRFLNLRVASNCEAGESTVQASDSALAENFILQCDAASLQSIQILGLERTLIDTLVSISYRDGQTLNRIITGKNSTLVLADSTPAVPTYFALGIQHLLFGFDHILFLIMVLYLVKTPLAMLKVVTSFTVAHSLTLVATTLGWLHLSIAPIEALIAASIVLVAYENLRSRRTLIHLYPVIVVFSFGLLHGLGFAGAFAELGLPRDSQVSALFLFNIGIEFGQLLIITVILLGVALIRKLNLAMHPFAFVAPCYFAGAMASFWLIQRVWLILLPLHV